MSTLKAKTPSVATDEVERDVAFFSRFLGQCMQGLLSSNYHIIQGEIGGEIELVFEQEKLVEAASCFASEMVKEVKDYREVVRFQNRKLDRGEANI